MYWAFPWAPAMVMNIHISGTFWVVRPQSRRFSKGISLVFSLVLNINFKGKHLLQQSFLCMVSGWWCLSWSKAVTVPGSHSSPGPWSSYRSLCPLVQMRSVHPPQTWCVLFWDESIWQAKHCNTWCGHWRPRLLLLIYLHEMDWG